MANPTTNFGWVLPTSTDLVTDLPADFEIALQGVDTSLVDLKGGTTGQLLKKASNTDMDFTWGIDPTSDLVTTAGDTIYATAADTLARLGIGTAGQVLTVNSGATAPEWASPAGGGKVLQVVTATTTTPTSVTATFTLADTGLSGSITPSSTNSKVLVLVTQQCILTDSTSVNGDNVTWALVRNSTVVQQQDYAVFFAGFTQTSDPRFGFLWNLHRLDSPNTTSAVTYKTQAMKLSSGIDSLAFQNSVSTITMLEIGA